MALTKQKMQPKVLYKEIKYTMKDNYIGHYMDWIGNDEM